MDTEKLWKDIDGFEGFYQVSNYGRVRSLTRTQIAMHNSGHHIQRTVQGHLLRATDNGHGYKIVGLQAVGKRRKNYYVHRLVAEAFVPKRIGCEVINHIDYDTSNNRADNLEWCTQIENVRHSLEHMMKPRSTSKRTNTGEKYISRKKYGYQVGIDRMKIWKSFKTLEEALRYRDEVMR